MNSAKFSSYLFMLSMAVCTTSNAYEPPAVPASAATLNEQQIRETLMGKKLHGTTREGSRAYTIIFSADGTDVFEMPPDAAEKERWTLKDGVVCVIPKGYPTECSQVKVANNEYWFVDPKNGKVNAHLKLKP